MTKIWGMEETHGRELANCPNHKIELDPSSNCLSQYQMGLYYSPVILFLFGCNVLN